MHAAHARQHLTAVLLRPHAAGMGSTKNGKRPVPHVWAASDSTDEDTDDEWWARAQRFQSPPRPARSSGEGAGPSGHGSLSCTFFDPNDPRCVLVRKKLAEADAAEEEAEATRRASAATKKDKAEERAAERKAKRYETRRAVRSLFPELHEPSTAPDAVCWWEGRAADPTPAAQPSKSDVGRLVRKPSAVSEPDSETDPESIPRLVDEAATDDDEPEVAPTRDRGGFKLNRTPHPNPTPNPALALARTPTRTRTRV